MPMSGYSTSRRQVARKREPTEGTNVHTIWRVRTSGKSRISEACEAALRVCLQEAAPTFATRIESSETFVKCCPFDGRRLRHPGPNAAAEWDRGPRVGSTVGRARLHNRRKGSRVPDFLGIGLTACGGVVRGARACPNRGPKRRLDCVFSSPLLGSTSDRRSSKTCGMPEP
jgi:hypothetical protein